MCTKSRVNITIEPAYGVSIKGKTWAYASSPPVPSGPTCTEEAATTQNDKVLCTVLSDTVPIEDIAECVTLPAQADDTDVSLVDLNPTMSANSSTVTWSALDKIGQTSNAIPVTPSPVKPNRVVKSNVRAERNDVCSICGESDERSFFLGCGHKNPVTKRADCGYWVHQNCIGLYFKEKEKLSKVPFYCHDHAPNPVLARKVLNVHVKYKYRLDVLQFMRYRLHV